MTAKKSMTLVCEKCGHKISDYEYPDGSNPWGYCDYCDAIRDAVPEQEYLHNTRADHSEDMRDMVKTADNEAQP